MAQCCACGDVSKVLASRGGGVELARGLAYVGRGKWLCSNCTKTAVAEFARAVAVETAKKLAQEAPPPGFV